MTGDKEIGKRMSERRKEMGLTREDFSLLINLSIEQVSAIEKGKRSTSVYNFVKIAEILNVTTDYLLMGAAILPEIQTNNSILINMIENYVSEGEAPYFIRIFKSLVTLKNKNALHAASQTHR